MFSGVSKLSVGYLHGTRKWWTTNGGFVSDITAKFWS